MKIDLKELGLSEGQSKVYSTLLELGSSSLNSIQEKTGYERRNIYDILNKLIDKGFVSYTVEKKVKVYQCTHPNNILEKIKEKKKSLTLIENSLPDIINLFNQKKNTINAEVYRGNESIKSLLDEAINHKMIYWIGGNSGIEKTSLKNWFNHWMKRRVEQKCWMYDLVDHGKSLANLNSKNRHLHNKNYYKLHQLPKNLSSPMVILIFGDKVAQILWSEQSFAFVLESKEIKKSYMKYFNYFWRDNK
ncbi:MAG: helix-turn-helix domain-containing protein [Candidatus Woesearchaeota archaeon]